jgi:hypothetical protein
MLIRTIGKLLSTLPSLVVVAMIGWLALGDCPALAQGSGAAITGTVKDVSGALLPGAAVTIKHLDTGLTRAAQADAGGNFSVPSLPVGEYEVTGEKMGFRKEVRNGINLAVGQEAVVDLTLQVGSIDQQVTVTGEAPLVNTTLSSTSGLITENQVKDLPLNGRSFDQLLTLNTGTVNNGTNVQNNGWTAFSVAGKRPETNRFLINGIDYVGGNAPGLFVTPSGASGQLLGVEAVREYNVLQSGYGAEYGKRAGGQISIVTSSGTNQLHGDVFEFLRNSALDARNFFDHTIGTPPFKRNQFGGALGGPLKKDKLFLFGNYEGFRQRLAQPSDAVVPDNFARLGELPNGAAVTGLQPKILPYLNAYYPAPNGPQLAGASNVPGSAHYYSNPRQWINEDFGLTRFDYIVSAKDSFSANYTIDKGSRSVPRADPNFTQDVEQNSQTLGLQETHVFSPSILNALTLGYGRAFATQSNDPVAPIPVNLAFLAGGNPGTFVIGGTLAVFATGIVAAEGTNLSQGVRNYFTYADDVHITKGRHSWSAGGWYQRIQQNQAGAALASAGSVSYPTLTAFLQDKPSQFIIQRNPIPVGYRTTEGAWYVQDEIKLRPNLTLRAGLRDEMTNGFNEVANRCANFPYDQNFVIQTNPTIGYSCLAHNNAKALWQPRVGLAWDPTGTGTWAVRASFGVHNDLLDNLGIQIYRNRPYNARELYTTSLLSLIQPQQFQKTGTIPPSCSADSPLKPPACVVYQPGGVDPNMFTPTVQEWSFTVERELTKSLMLQVAYVGSQSYHTNISMDTNSAPAQVCQNSAGCSSGGTQLNGRAYGVLANGKPDPTQPPVFVPQGTAYLPPGLRPNPYVSSLVSWFGEGTASYHSLNVSLVKRASRGLTFKANYTYAKVLDLNSAVLAPAGENEAPSIITPYNLGLNKGPASYSLNHQFNANFSYQLPFGSGQRFGAGAKGFLNQLIGGWQWNGIVNAQGGFPITPLVGSNTSGTGDATTPDPPNWNPNFKGPVVLKDPNQWFDPRAFLIPTQGTFGNGGRGTLRGPGYVNVDTSFFKKIRISERLNMQFRAEAFNIFNHSNFSYPNDIVFAGNQISPTAGLITGTNGFSRQLQLALKLIF